MRAASHTDALPVRLVVAGRDAAALRRWIESVVGWQAVDDETAALVPPRVTIADVEGAGAAPADLPLLVVVATSDDPVRAAVAGRQAAAVLAWPAARDDLVAAVAHLTATTEVAASTMLRVGGASGGVGTTTVALALAATFAWRGRPTLMVARGAVPIDGVVQVEGDGVDGFAVGTSPPGCAHLRVVHAPAARVEPGRAAVVVSDVGVDDDADILVVRRDRPGLEALARTVAAVAVVVDTGPADARALRSAAAGRRLVTVAWSQRVARAGLMGRVPAGLPGAWLRALAPALGAS